MCSQHKRQYTHVQCTLKNSYYGRSIYRSFAASLPSWRIRCRNIVEVEESLLSQTPLSICEGFLHQDNAIDGAWPVSRNFLVVDCDL